MALPVEPPEVCPVCGESVPRDARACPGCGADERSGWNKDATRYDGLGLPDEAFEAEPSRRPRPSPLRDRFWTAVIFAVLAGLIIIIVFR